MKSTVEELEPTKIKLTVDVDTDELKPAIDQAYKKVAEQITIPGFRKGKVPAAIINQRVGWGPVVEQAVNDALPGLYAKAAEENKLRPLSRPEVEITAIPEAADKGTLSFTANVTVRPKLELPEISEIELVVPPVEVTDEDVNEQLDFLRERFGALVGVDRPAVEGDFVTMDLIAKIGSEEVDSVSGVSYQIGAGNMLEGLDEALTGMSSGETTTFRTNLAGGEHAGEEADVTVEVTGVQERELPEADDDFAQMASEYDTIEELKQDIHDGVELNKSGHQAVAARTALVEKLRDGITVPIPEDVVEERVHAHLENEGRLDDEVHRAEVTEQTRIELGEQLLLDTLAEELAIKVTQNEVVQFLAQASQQYGMQPQEFIQAVSQSGAMPHMIGEVARSKAAAMALRKVKVKDENGADVDLTTFIGSDELDAAQEAMEQQFAAVQAAAQNVAQQGSQTRLDEPEVDDSYGTPPINPGNPAAIPNF